jgi:hypothetical protein
MIQRTPWSRQVLRLPMRAALGHRWLGQVDDLTAPDDVGGWASIRLIALTLWQALPRHGVTVFGQRPLLAFTEAG